MVRKPTPIACYNTVVNYRNVPQAPSRLWYTSPSGHAAFNDQYVFDVKACLSLHHLFEVERTMVLCEACRGINFRRLFIACLEQCRDRQAIDDVNSDIPPCPPSDSNISEHHGDIFEIRDCAPRCDLCNIISQAFEKRPLRATEDARGLPIAFRPYQNRIEVCYNTIERLVPLCRLDIYMHGPSGE